MDGDMKMKYKLDKDAFRPEKAHKEDAGWDLKAPEGFIVEAGDSILIDTGIHIAIPAGYVGMLKTKSSLNAKGLSTEGVIDSGYTGSIRVKIYNHSRYFNHSFDRGDKLTQLVIIPICTEGMEEVDELEKTERGNGGFGSTGR